MFLYYYSIIPAFPLVVAGVRSECQCLHHVTPEMIRTIVVIGTSKLKILQIIMWNIGMA